MGIRLDAPVRALLIGAATGLRASVPVALVNLQARRGRLALGDDLFATVTRRIGVLSGSRLVVGSTALGAAGELALDKVPDIPSRLEPGALLGRVAVGALLGAVIHRDAGRALPTGVLLGALGAAAGAVAGANLRATAATRTPLPDPVVAAAEDLTCLGLTTLALTTDRG